MSIQTPICIVPNQKENKPLIESVAPLALEGVMLDDAMDFIAYLRANKIKPIWAQNNMWKGMYKGKVLYYMGLENPKYKDRKTFWVDKFWHFKIYPNHINEYEEHIRNEGLQDFVWDNLGYCRNCCGDPSGVSSCAKTVTVLGKTFNNFGCWPLVWVFNPNNVSIDSIKRLLELEKNARDEINAKR